MTSTLPAFVRQIKKKFYGQVQTAKLIFPAGCGEIALHECQSILADPWEKQQFTPEFILEKNEIYVRNIHLVSLYELLLRSLTLTDVQLIIFKKKLISQYAFECACKAVDWSYYLIKTMRIKVKVKSIASIAFHETALKNTLEYILQSFAQLCEKENPAQFDTQVSADFYKNKLTLSISLGGQPLYQRGFRKLSGALAPLREDIAASCLQRLFQQSPFTKKTLVCIPFSGTGTFAFEVIMQQQHILSIFFQREFAVRLMPFHKNKTFDFLIKKAKEKMLPQQQSKIICIDHASAAEVILKENLALFNAALIKNALIQENFSIQYMQADFLKIDLKDYHDQDIFLGLNPPYGIRLQQQQNTDQFYGQIAMKINQLQTLHPTQRVFGFILVPTESAWSQFLKILQHKKTRTYHINQGGLDVRVVEFA